MKIATWNVNSLKIRLPQVLNWLATHQPEVLALQETKTIDTDFPAAAIEAAGYHVVYSGQKAYNGVAILSRAPGTDVLKDVPGLDDPQRRIIAVTVGNMRVLNLYIPNGENLISPKYAYKMAWLNILKNFISEERQRYPNLVIVGDFNIAPHDKDVYDPREWAGQVLCSAAERKMFSDFIDLGFADCFRLHKQADQSYTWWDYRLNAFKRNRGLRIDHILASEQVAKNCTSCYIDTIPRGWERPSDHTPIVAEFAT